MDVVCIATVSIAHTARGVGIPLPRFLDMMSVHLLHQDSPQQHVGQLWTRKLRARKKHFALD